MPSKRGCRLCCNSKGMQAGGQGETVLEKATAGEHYRETVIGTLFLKEPKDVSSSVCAFA